MRGWGLGRGGGREGGEGKMGSTPVAGSVSVGLAHRYCGCSKPKASMETIWKIEQGQSVIRPNRQDGLALCSPVAEAAMLCA